MKKLFILLMSLFLFLAACSEPSDSKTYTPSVSYTDSFTIKKNGMSTTATPASWSYNLLVDYVITKCKPNARYEVTICYNSKYEFQFYALSDNNGNITGTKNISNTFYQDSATGVDSFTLILSE